MILVLALHSNHTLLEEPHVVYAFHEAFVGWKRIVQLLSLPCELPSVLLEYRVPPDVLEPVGPAFAVPFAKLPVDVIKRFVGLELELLLILYDMLVLAPACSHLKIEHPSS